MKRIAAGLLLGPCLISCEPSVPALTPPLVGRWEQVAVHTVTHDPTGRLLEDRHHDNEPGSVWLELTASDSVFLVYEGVRVPTGTWYAYRVGSLRFRDASLGETVHPVTALSSHRLVYRTHNQSSAGTEDVTFTYKR